MGRCRRVSRLCCCCCCCPRCCCCLKIPAGLCWCTLAAAIIPIVVVAVALLETPSVVTLPTTDDFCNAQGDIAQQVTESDEAAPAPNPALSRTFDRIASEYDSTNRWLSLGLAQRWRQALVQDCLRLSPGDHVLDLATGTADVGLLAAAVLRHLGDSASAAPVIGVDPSAGMLEQAIDKAKTLGLQSHSSFFRGSAEDLSAAIPLNAGSSAAEGIASASVDKISMAFGIGHLSDRRHAFREMRRVLRRPGHLCLLDVSLPTGEAAVSKLARVFLQHAVPLVATVARLIAPGSDGEEAARRLEEAALDLPEPMALAKSLRHEGLPVQKITSFAFGTVHLYEASLAGECPRAKQEEAS